MPPVSPIAVSCLSVRFRECGLKACALECVATRGALLIAATSQNPRSLRCDRSIKIPNRLQAPISSLPRSVRPGPVSGEEGQRNGTPCPKAFDRLQTGPRERSPAAYNTSRNSKFGSIASAPSICRTGANTPSSMPCWISSTLRQTRTRPCDSLSIRRRKRHHGEDSPLRRHQFNGRRQRGAAADVLRRCFAIGTNRPISRRDKDREQPSSESPLTRYRKIQLALTLPCEERLGRVRAAAPVKTQQDVIVAVEDRYAPRRCHQSCSVAEILELPDCSLGVPFGGQYDVGT